MAEVLGVVATAFTLFQQVQAGFTVFTTAKSFREDGDTVRCMIQWEDYRFRRWGEASGLPAWDQVHSESDLPNGSPALNWALIANTLRVLHNLLVDTDKLKSRYRLHLTEDDGKAEGNDSEASSRRMKKLFRLPERTPTAAQEGRPKVGLVKRISWAIDDKDQVQKLVTDISGLNDHLMALLDTTWQMSIQKNLAKLVEEAETRAETAGDRAILRKALEDSLRDQKAAAEKRLQNLDHATRAGNLEEVQLLFTPGTYDDTYYSPLKVAVEAEQLAIARFLLENGESANRVEEGKTPLLLIAKKGGADMLSLLLGFGADKAAVDRNGRNAVLISAEGGNVAVLEELLKDPFFRDQDCVDPAGITGLQIAAEEGNREVLEVLFGHYPKDLNRAENKGRSMPPLLSAVNNGHVDAIKFLLSCPGIEVDITSRFNTNTRNAGQTALMLAATYWRWETPRRVEMLDILRKAGASVNHQDDQGYCALAWAAWGYRPDAIAHILTWDDIDFNLQSVSGSPLCIAAQKGRKDMVQMLLDRKPDLDVRDKNGKTALALAATGPDDKDAHNIYLVGNEQAYKIVCRKLLKAGIPIDEADSKGRTPLLIAAEKGFALIVEFLLEQGANVEAEDEDGETALDFAKQKKLAHVVQVLENHVRKTWVCSRCKSEETR